MIVFLFGVVIGYLCYDLLRSMLKTGISEGAPAAKHINRTYETVKEDLEDALAEGRSGRSMPWRQRLTATATVCRTTSRPSSAATRKASTAMATPGAILTRC